MKPVRICICIVLIPALLLSTCSPEADSGALASGKSPLVVFLVRHGEKLDDSEDPALSAQGQERASTLARILRDAKIEYIHSSDFRRTRDTAAPTASALGLNVALYDPYKLSALVKKMHNTGGRHLVAGHSNTTPQLVKLLGGMPGSEIDEKSEYDRLYIVSVASRGLVNTVLIRYGNEYKPPPNE